jgi:hypothetical protein
MKTNINTRRILSTCLLLALPLVGCVQDDVDSFEDSDDIGESIGQINGGLDMEDEAPMFGEEGLFDSAQLVNEEEANDTIGENPVVVAMGALPNVARVHAALRWGQIPFNPAAETVMDWSGTISVNRGAIIVRRVIAFEPLFGDAIDRPRTDPQSVSFTSTTLPANDGLRLTILDPTPDAEEPLTLSYTSALGDYSIVVADMVGSPQVFDVGDDGNRLVAVAMAQQTDPCDHGFIGGRWHKVAPDRGRLLGQVRAANGDLLGHMRGLYGQRLNGNKVFFGKYINTEGAFRGLFAGRYQNGFFLGLWMTRAGEFGALGGRYQEGLPGDPSAGTPEIGGHFLGRWGERSCAQVGSGNDQMPDQPE